jgi:hypothetical protein
MATATFGGKVFFLSEGDGVTKGTGGPLYTYRIGVQAGLDLSLDSVSRFIDSVLGHKTYGWTRTGRVRFRHAGQTTPGTYILIAEPGTVDVLCAPLDTSGYVSCRNGNKVILNSNRWKVGVPHYQDQGILAYRTMLVNHEMGHRIGQKHRTCPGIGRSAPVMLQQTYSLQGCKANWWPLNSEVATLPLPTATGAASLMHVIPEEVVDPLDDEMELD